MEKPAYIIEQLDQNGKLVLYHEGPTQTELHQAHLDGKCHSTCGYCYEEFCQMMADPNHPIHNKTNNAE